MTYEELTVLIPSHSLEDFPTELGEEPAGGLLNAFAVLWHPRLLASGEAFPQWRRADESHDVGPNRLVIVPTASDDWIPHGWVERARSEGCVVLTGITGREEMLDAALGPLDEGQVGPTVDSDLTADFIALGSCYLQIELLTRHMRNFSNLDEVHMQREAVAAAKAAVSDDRVATETHLRNCFEMLLEARERFYPVDCFLIDLCLLIPRLANEHFAAMLEQKQTAVNLLTTVGDLEEIRETEAEAFDRLREGVDGGRIDVIGGEWSETCTSLMSVNSVIWELQRGARILQSLLGRRPATWGRRRFGVGPLMPQLLSRCAFTSALHFVMDDGLYPDDEQSQFRWEGCDGSVINAISRIPLAADSASSFLRFPVRMSESMDQDHTAAVVFARWPELRSPWLEDFHRIQKYAPVLGRFITLRDFFDRADVPGRLSSFSAGEYLTPFLIQSVARDEADPISRYIDYWNRRREFEACEWIENLSQLLRTGCVSRAGHQVLEDTVELATPEATPEEIQSARAALNELSSRSPARLAGCLASGAGDGPGMLIVNTLSFPRQVQVDWPPEVPLPARNDAIEAVQADEGGRALRVKLPGSGFVWIPNPTQETLPTVEKLATAEELLLRNEFFEVSLSDVTGGIGQIRTYKRSPNRVSQQLAYRFPQERTVTIGEGEQQEQFRTYYSEMVLKSTRVLRSGPVVGEIETAGVIVDPQNREALAGFRQVTRIWRGKPLLEVEFELDADHLPDGNPWTNYYGIRFAWKHETTAISRSQHHGAHVVTSERFESPEFIELADEEFRTTILPCGLPFHRKTGPRMLDTIAVTAGETRRRFRFAVVIDEQYPLGSALDWETPPVCVPTTGSPPANATTGWLFHVSSRNVQLQRILPLLLDPDAADADSDASGCRLRLMETEGRRKNVTLRCFRAPTSARQQDFLGETLQTLPIDGDQVSLEVGRFEVCDVELRFDE